MTDKKKFISQLMACQCEKTSSYDLPPTLNEMISQDSLQCIACGQTYLIRNGVLRLVEGADHYVENFGKQWLRFRETQIDRLAGHTLSTDRFDRDTGWTRSALESKWALDAGCGAGRFTDVMAEKGANVVSVDLSHAVDACRKNCSNADSPERGDVIVAQGDILDLPFNKGQFDFVHCAGVIQHTPDPKNVMLHLASQVKPGGQLFFNFYEKSNITKFQVIKYFLRRYTPNWPNSVLEEFCQTLCVIFFLPSWGISKIPILRQVNRLLPICSVHPKGLSLATQYQLTLLDTLDWYGPQYEYRQDHNEVASILRKAGFVNVKSDPGRAWGQKPK